ncbi:hypothetical protein FRAHR75_470041 [Frankia sp. Hr75.2]|nr:hypothetical protein FRAHR75_470041 [Frankia sp. Hr75.2]
MTFDRRCTDDQQCVIVAPSHRQPNQATLST